MKRISVILVMLACLSAYGQEEEYWARGAALWTPTNLVGLAWLHGGYVGNLTNGATVTTWADWSGNAYNATCATAYAGAAFSKYVTFSTARTNHMIINNSAMPAQGHSVYAAIRVNSNATTKIIVGRAYNFGGFSLSVLAAGTVRHTAGGADLISPSFITTNQTHVIAAIHTGSSKSLYIDGTLVTNINEVLGPIGYHINDVAAIGAARPTSGAPVATWSGDIYGVFISNTAHDTASRQRMEGYYAWFCGSQALLPVSHPYRNAPPRKN